MRILTAVAPRYGCTRERGGFTLPDLVITTLIIGIFAAIAAPKLAGTLHCMRAQAAAQRIVADLRYVRQTAISRSASMTVSFVPSSHSYSIATLTDWNRPGKPYAVSLSAPPYSARLVSAALGADADVRFDRYGTPDSGGTITVESGGVQQTVTIDPETGKASMP